MTTPEVYESLHTINQAASTMAQHIERLKAAGILSRDMARLHSLTIEETRALICQSVTITLSDHEEDGAFTTQQARFAVLDSLKDEEPAQKQKKARKG